MNDSEQSLASAITSTRSYGATHSRIMTEIDTNLIKHQLQPTDTLQGLAIKYGVTVEKLKRLNKLWSNESMMAKDFILIPFQDKIHKDMNECAKKSKDITEMYVKPDAPLHEVREHKRNKKKFTQDTIELGSDGELGSSTNEDTDCGSSGTMKDFTEIISKADHHINVYKQQRGEGSEAFKAFNDILTNIDKTIEIHKNRAKNLDRSPDLPTVSYDGNYQTSNPGLFSPTSQHPYLEHGI
ncbi:lysM and putative peptidoglycan-binding domain-containing protein 1-like [Clytia hemisphaerica]